MKYMGSKNRIAKYIIPHILDHIRPNMPFIDACCGGCNIIDKLPNDIKKYANDINKYLISFWVGLQNNLEYPKIIDKDFYSKVRHSFNSNDDTYSDFIKGFVGFMGSYNGRFFDGGYSGHNVKGRDYIGESIRNIEKQILNLHDVKFTNKNLLEINPSKPSLIYCDIPYKNTKQYKTESFDYESFYQWCIDKKNKGNIILVSEYYLPAHIDHEILWEMEVKIHLKTQNKHNAIERLFLIK